MRGLKSGEVQKPREASEMQQIIANFANEAVALLASREPNDSVAVDDLLTRYRTCLRIDNKRFDSMLKLVTEKFSELTRDLADQPLRVKFIEKLAGRHAQGQAGNTHGQPPSAEDVGIAAVVEHQVDQTIEVRGATQQESEAILADGLQEVTNILLEEHTLPQIFNMVLETMFRGMGFNRVILCLQDKNMNQMVARLGFGTDTQAVVKNFCFTLHYSADVFHASLKKGVDVYIADASDQKVRADLPGWYKVITGVGCFLLFPLVVNKRSLGLIYADHPDAHGLQMKPKQLNLLKALRNQLVLALREKL